MSYGMLSRESAAQRLRQIQPDALVLDEAHMLRGWKSARTQVLVRYWLEFRPIVWLLSGTLLDDNPATYAHLLEMALPGQRVLKLDKRWLESLTLILQGLAAPQDYIRLRFPRQWGARQVRAWYAKRLMREPGVMKRQADKLGTSLWFSIKRDLPYPADVYAQVAKENRRPDGEFFPDSLSLWRCLTQLSYGFYYRWIEARPEEWLLARTEFFREVRARIGKAELSAKPVMRRMQAEGHRLWLAWDSARQQWGDTPPTETIWLRRPKLRLEGPGVVWVKSKALAQFLALPHCSDESLPRVWASVQADREGRNLQYTWAHNWILEPPIKAEHCEQLLGRTHRQGQKAETVTVTFFQHSPVLRRALAKCKAQARRFADLGITNRLLTGDWER